MPYRERLPWCTITYWGPSSDEDSDELVQMTRDGPWIESRVIKGTGDFDDGLCFHNTEEDLAMQTRLFDLIEHAYRCGRYDALNTIRKVFTMEDPRNG